MLRLLAVPLLFWPTGADLDSCTTIAVTKGASADGSTMTTHTSDCSQCDSRVARIPARTWPEGAMRPIYLAKLDYPREVSYRSSIYYPKDGQELSTPTGFIPEVRSTYAYWEAVYGYMNEHGLSLGESTAAANFPVSRDNLTALMWIRPLTQVAMERCKTARCAVHTMGELAEEYGFYGEDPGASGAGECLTIADGEEVWIFEITGDTTGKSAFWAAQRVPEGHVTVIANNFVLRGLNCDDTENFACSTDLLAKAQKAGAWDGRGTFDWGKSMGPDIRYYSYTPGFPPIPEYTTARIWRIFTQVAPSLGIKRVDDTYYYPVTVKAEWPITARDLMDLKRDHYEGTEIDLTVGGAAGPFGSPNRLEGGVGMKLISGGAQFARAISLPRTSYCTLCQSFLKDHTSMDKMWFASDTPASSVFVPFYANTTDYAEEYRTGSMNEYDEKSAWWVFDFVSNWMNINYRLMSVDVNAKIAELQDVIDAELQTAESWARRGPSADFAHLEQFQTSIQGRIVDKWRTFGKSLIVKYNDGVINHPTGPQNYGYPAWFLEMFGVDNDIRPKWAMPSKGNAPPSFFSMLGAGPFEVLPNASHKFLPAALAARTAEVPTLGAGWALLLFSYVLVFTMGWVLSRRNFKSTEEDVSAKYLAMAGQ